MIMNTQTEILTSTEISNLLKIDKPKFAEFDDPKYKDLWFLLDDLCIRQNKRTGYNEYYDYNNLSTDEQRQVLRQYYKCQGIHQSQHAWNDTCDWNDRGMTKQMLTEVVLGDDKYLDEFTLRNLRSWMRDQVLKEDPADLITEYIDMIITREQADDPRIMAEIIEREEENRLNDPRHEEYRYG